MLPAISICIFQIWVAALGPNTRIINQVSGPKIVLCPIKKLSS